MQTSRFREIVDFSEKFYKRRNRIYNKNLKLYIYLTKQGWDHIRYGNNNNRKSNDILRRMALLKCALEIVEDASFFQNITFRGSKVYYCFEAIYLTKFLSKVRVVLLLDKSENLKFHSVMDRKIENGRMSQTLPFLKRG